MSMNQKPSIDEGEWAAQERGLHAARQRHAGAPDAASDSYRVLAELLQSTPLPEPPADFAASVTAYVAAQEGSLERLLSRLLLGALIVCVIAVSVFYGPTCWRLLAPLLPGDTLGLLLAGAGCVMLTGLLGKAREAQLLRM